MPIYTLGGYAGTVEGRQSVHVTAEIFDVPEGLSLDSDVTVTIPGMGRVEGFIQEHRIALAPGLRRAQIEIVGRLTTEIKGRTETVTVIDEVDWMPPMVSEFTELVAPVSGVDGVSELVLIDLLLESDAGDTEREVMAVADNHTQNGLQEDEMVLRRRFWTGVSTPRRGGMWSSRDIRTDV